MSILYSHHFYRQIRKFEKKFPNFLKDINQEIIETDPKNSISLGKDIYKARISISSLKKGKSGSFRLIFSFFKIKSIIIPITMYQKSEYENISKKDIIKQAKQVYEEIQQYL